MARKTSNCRALRFEWDATVRSSTQLGSTSKIVATALALTFFNAENRQCNPSVPKLAKKVGKSERSVQRALKLLEESGFLSVARPPGRTSTNSYGLLLNGQDIIKASVHKDLEAETHLDAVTKCASKGVTSLRRTGDSDATTLKGTILEPVEMRRDAGRSRGMATPELRGPTLFVGAEDQSCIASWNGWFAAQGKPGLFELGLQTTRGGNAGWILPSRFAPSTDQANAWALHYFAAVFKEAG